MGTRTKTCSYRSWYGTADVDLAGIHNNYLTELVIRQKGNEVEGVFGYYFKDTYQSFFVRGTYNPQTKEIHIKNIPIIFYNTNSTVNSVECNTNFIGTLFISKVKTSLTGHFYHDGKYKYTCPDLRANYSLFTDKKEPDSILSNAVAIKKIWKPQPNDSAVNASESPKEAAEPPSAKSSATAAVVAVAPPLSRDSIAITAHFHERKNVLAKEIEVESDSLRVSFYDNGDIDGDSISVFMNDQLVLKHQELSEKAFNIYVMLDTMRDVNEISMFAENLGKYPPNTALMVLTDGNNRYEVYVSSDLKANGVLRLRRKKPADKK